MSKKHNILFIILSFAVAVSVFAQSEAGDGRSQPFLASRWIQPAPENGFQLRWGFRDGIRVGLVPNIVRGLIAIYTPYAGQRPEENINFLAIEPVPKGETERGFSELEQSQLDHRPGKRIWTSNDDSAYEPRDAESLVFTGKTKNEGSKKPASGIIQMENGEETLAVFFFVEPFLNQAKVYVKAKFYASKPYEVEITTYQRRDSRELANCIITATMGNYARLRKLYSKDGVKTASEIWPNYTEHEFAPHEIVSRHQMIAGKDGYSYFIATPDEKNPQDSQYDPNTRRHWKYMGNPVVQYWYCKDPDDSLQGLVNGRVVYWASQTSIPGGIAFENFEMRKQFKDGDRFVFGVSPLPVEDFIKEHP